MAAAGPCVSSDRQSHVSTTPGHPRAPHATSTCTPSVQLAPGRCTCTARELGLRLALGAAINLACCGHAHMQPHSNSPGVSRLVCHGEGSLCRWPTMPQPAACLRCSIAVATRRTASARKAHMIMPLPLKGGAKRGVGPRLLVLMAPLAERYLGALSRWKCYALCSQLLSLCFVVPATAQHLHCLRDNNLSAHPKSMSKNKTSCVCVFAQL